MRDVEEGLAASAVSYAMALRHQVQFSEALNEALDRLSPVALPATTTTAPDLTTTGDTFNSPWSYAGVPSITIPCGLADDGLPCGLQLIGPRHSELRLLRAAAWCEEQLGFEQRPPMLSD